MTGSNNALVSPTLRGRADSGYDSDNKADSIPGGVLGAGIAVDDAGARGLTAVTSLFSADHGKAVKNKWENKVSTDVKKTSEEFSRGFGEISGNIPILKHIPVVNRVAEGLGTAVGSPIGFWVGTTIGSVKLLKTAVTGK